MARKVPLVLWIAVPLAFVLYFYRLSAVGLIGPDEPRYASIAREMARSGDWITPRLWGEGWFEKPPLLYWMSGIAFRCGLGPEIAPRLPVALMAAAFLVFYWWILNREFGVRTACFATMILGTCAGWIGFSQVGVTDLPMTATFSAAMLLALPWVEKRDSRFLPIASALLGFAVLGKSGVPIVLSLPLLWNWNSGDNRSVDRAGNSRTLWQRYCGLRGLSPKLLVPFLIVAVPWHVLCYLRNGSIFPYTLFVQHQVQRMTSDALQHTQHWWYYLPVFCGLLLPWTPILFLAARRAAIRDPRRRFLMVWVLFGLVFFSAAPNKLPGYVLPLLPAAAVLMALGLEETDSAGSWLAACAFLLVTILLAAPILPQAVAVGLTRAPRPPFQWIWLLPVAVAALVFTLDRRSHRLAAVFSLAAASACAVVYVKQTATSELDRLASARPVWRQIADRTDQVCANRLKRDFRYGLNYYSGVPLPECAVHPEPLQIVQRAGMPPETVDLH
ncbi:MAG TPA: glycosyltransferase family 39 protein [Bryobacteraceae bacterium]|nr:glycosyltransferase family 39 protein [Bryobacteraceae bacterium]